MKCGGCGFNTFDYLDKCTKCGTVFSSNARFKQLYKSYKNLLNNSDKRSRINNLKSEGLDDTLIIEPNDHAGHEIKTSNPDSYSDTARDIPPDTGSVNQDLNSIKKTSQLEQRPNPVVNSYIFEPDFKYDQNLIYVQASAESRIAAWFIDFAILNILSITCLYFALLISGYKIDRSLLQIKEVIIPVYLVLLFLSTSYFVLMQGFGGRTIGKLILRLKVIKKDGLEIGYMDSFVRFVGYFISIIPAFLGILWSYIDSNSQAWHDKIAGTVVIEK